MRDRHESRSRDECCLRDASRARVLADEWRPPVAVARPGAAHGVGARRTGHPGRSSEAHHLRERPFCMSGCFQVGEADWSRAADSKPAEGSSILPARAQHNFIETGLHGHRTRESAERLIAMWHRANRHKAVEITVRPRPVREWGRTQQRTASGRSRTRQGAATCQPRRPVWRQPGCQRRGDASVGQLVGPPGCNPGPFGACRFESCPAHPCLASIVVMLRTLNPESKVRFLGEAPERVKPEWSGSGLENRGPRERQGFDSSSLCRRE